MTKQPGHRRGAAVTEHVLQTTIDLIARDGPSLSIDDVASAAGVNKTTVYRRWSEVGDLIADAIRSHAEKAVPIEPTGDVRTDLRCLCHDVVANLRSPVGRAVLAAARQHTDLAPLRHAFWSERLSMAADLLAPLGLTHGADLAASMMEWLVAPLHFRETERGLPVDDDYIDALVDHFLRGLAATPRPRPTRDR